MRMMIHGAVLALTTALYSGVALADVYPPAPPIDSPKPFKVPAVETYALPNGLKVTLVPYGIAPKVTVRLNVDAGELDGGKDTALGDLAADLAGLFTLKNSYTAGLLGSITERDLLGLPADWLDRYVPGILAVTPADIQAQAVKRLPLETATLVVVGDLKTVVPQLKAEPELKDAAMQTVTVP